MCLNPNRIVVCDFCALNHSINSLLRACNFGCIRCRGAAMVDFGAHSIGLHKADMEELCISLIIIVHGVHRRLRCNAWGSAAHTEYRMSVNCGCVCVCEYIPQASFWPCTIRRSVLRCGRRRHGRDRRLRAVSVQQQLNAILGLPQKYHSFFV